MVGTGTLRWGTLPSSPRAAPCSTLARSFQPPRDGEALSSARRAACRRSPAFSGVDCRPRRTRTTGNPAFLLGRHRAVLHGTYFSVVLVSLPAPTAPVAGTPVRLARIVGRVLRLGRCRSATHVRSRALLLRETGGGERRHLAVRWAAAPWAQLGMPAEQLSCRS